MTSRTLFTPELWQQHLAAGRKDAVCRWLTANGLDPNAVLGTYPVTIDDSANGPQIHCTVIELDADQPEQRTVPLVVAPPDDWPVYETMTATTDPQPAR